MRTRRLQICIALLLAVFLFLPGRDAAADENIKIRVELEPRQVVVGDEVTYSVIVEGEDIPQDLSPNVKGLTAEGLELVSTRTSRQVVSGSSFTVVINGKVVTDEKTGSEVARVEHILRPSKPGSYKLGPAEVIIRGERYTAKPVTLKVSVMPSPGENEPRAVSDIFVRANPSAKKLWKGQLFTITYYLYIKESMEASIDRRPEIPELDGFIKYDFESPGAIHPSRVTLNGQTYLRAYIGRLIVFPTRAGKLTIPPLKQKYAERKAINPYGFFPQYRSVEGEASASPVTVQVRPLPQAGRPDDFTQAVGQFNVSAEIDGTSVRAGENVTLTVKLIGTGNLEGAGDPAVTLPPSVESYPPEVDKHASMDADNLHYETTYRYILVAREAGKVSIGPVKFNYFDPVEGRYKVSTSGPLILNVAPGAAASSNRKIARSGPKQVKLGKDIRYIKPDAQSLSESSPLALSGRWFIALHVLPLVLLGAAVLWRKQRERLSTDVAYARRAKAYDTAGKRIKLARKAGPESDDYHRWLYRAVAGYMADMFNLPDVGMTDEDYFKPLQEAGVSATDIERIRNFLEKCCAARYLPGGVEHDKARNLIEEAGEIVKLLRKILRENHAG